MKKDIPVLSALSAISAFVSIEPNADGVTYLLKLALCLAFQDLFFKISTEKLLVEDSLRSRIIPNKRAKTTFRNHSKLHF